MNKHVGGQSMASYPIGVSTPAPAAKNPINSSCLGGYYNYLVSFSDGTVKTGITKNPFYRLQDFIQEAHRHSVKIDGFEITQPVKYKKIALKIESDFCSFFSHDAIEGHREWFKEDTSWASEQYLKEREPKFDFESKLGYLNSLRDKFDHFYYPPAGITPLKYLRNRWEIKSKFQELKDLASELGKRGERMKAALATRMANEIVSEVLR
jgi:hypothetical protein